MRLRDGPGTGTGPVQSWGPVPALGGGPPPACGLRPATEGGVWPHLPLPSEEQEQRPCGRHQAELTSPSLPEHTHTHAENAAGRTDLFVVMIFLLIFRTDLSAVCFF